MARPILKIELSKTDKFIEISAWSILAALWIVTLYSFIKLPEIMPIHFDINGKVNGTAHKSTIFLLPIIVTILFIGLTYLNRFPHTFNYIVNITPENALTQYTIYTRMIRILKLSTGIIFIIISIGIYFSGINNAASLGAWFLAFSLVMLLMPMIYFIIWSFKEK